MQTFKEFYESATRNFPAPPFEALDNPVLADWQAKYQYYLKTGAPVVQLTEDEKDEAFYAKGFYPVYEPGGGRAPWDKIGRITKDNIRMAREKYEEDSIHSLPEESSPLTVKSWAHLKSVVIYFNRNRSITASCWADLSNEERKEWEARYNNYMVVEREAKRLYELLPYEQGYGGAMAPEKPKWEEGGNSIIQDQCRDKAKENLLKKMVTPYVIASVAPIGDPQLIGTEEQKEGFLKFKLGVKPQLTEDAIKEKLKYQLRDARSQKGEYAYLEWMRREGYDINLVHTEQGAKVGEYNEWLEDQVKYLKSQLTEDTRAWPEDNPDKEALNIIGRILYHMPEDSASHNFNLESLVRDFREVMNHRRKSQPGGQITEEEKENIEKVCEDFEAFLAGLPSDAQERVMNSLKSLCKFPSLPEIHIHINTLNIS